MRNNQHGFTLPELLAACLLLLLLAVISAALLHPQDFGPENRNSQRRLNLAQTALAIRGYYQKNGNLPPSITLEGRTIGSGKDDANLCRELVPAFAKAIEGDPQLEGSTEEATTCQKGDASFFAGYAVAKTKDGKAVILAAPYAEKGEDVSLEFSVK